MQQFGRFFVGVAVVAVYFWFTGYPTGSSLPPNAPDGAIEYFEMENGSITLFENRIEAEGNQIMGGPLTINIDDISSIKKTGLMVSIHDKYGSWLQLSMVTPMHAKRFKESVEDLMYED